jgi:hypothetical protein
VTARHLVVAVQSKVPGGAAATVTSMVDDAPTDPYYGTLYTGGVNVYQPVIAGPSKLDNGMVAQLLLSYVVDGPPQILVLAPTVGASYNGFEIAITGVGTPGLSFSPVYTPGVGIAIQVATDGTGDATTSWQDIVDWIVGNTPYQAFKVGANFYPAGNNSGELANGADQVFTGRVRTELWVGVLLHPVAASNVLTVTFDTAVDEAQAAVLAYSGINVNVDAPAGVALSGLAAAYQGVTPFNGVAWEYVVL